MKSEALFPSFTSETCHAGKHGNVLPIDIAGAKAIAAAVVVADKQTVPILEAAGRIAATKVLSPINLPPFGNSAMDGFAVRTAHFEGSGPWQFPLAGRIAAGDSPFESDPNICAVRIFTGAPVPEGFDAVIMQESCQWSGDRVLFDRRPCLGMNIRRAGEDIARGGAAVSAGQVLNAPRIALLAAIGFGSVEVWRKVRVGLISTGSELREPGQPLAPGQIYNSNRHFLIASLTRPWAEIIDYGIVADNPEAIRVLVRKASETCDVVLTTGGVSAGGEDHMMDVLKRENAKLEVLKVAIRPGKPVTVGKIGRALYFGLPGNPYAAAVTFSRIALPAIKATAGYENLEIPWMPAISGFSYSRKPGCTEFVPVTWNRRDEEGRPVVEMLGRGSSASMRPVALAMGTAVLPPYMTNLEPGEPLRIEMDYE